MENNEPQLINVLIKHEKWAELKNDKVKPFYDISSTTGNVRNKITGHILSPREINTGYITVNLRCNDDKGRNFLQHRLVAETFVPHDNINQNTVNHKDGNKHCNSAYNLEWNTQKENNDHARLTGLNNISGSNQHMAILVEEQVHTICKLLESSIPYKEILDTIGLDSSDPNSNNYDLIGNIRRGIAWRQISRLYDFSNTFYTNCKYTNDQIQTMCSYLEAGDSFKEIYEKMFNLPYISSRVNKSYYEFIRKLRNRQAFPEITKDYTF